MWHIHFHNNSNSIFYTFDLVLQNRFLCSFFIPMYEVLPGFSWNSPSSNTLIIFLRSFARSIPPVFRRLIPVQFLYILLFAQGMPNSAPILHQQFGWSIIFNQCKYNSRYQSQCQLYKKCKGLLVSTFNKQYICRLQRLTIKQQVGCNSIQERGGDAFQVFILNLFFKQSGHNSYIICTNHHCGLLDWWS